MKSKSDEISRKNLVYRFIKGTYRVGLAPSVIQDMRNLSVLVEKSWSSEKKSWLRFEQDIIPSRT